ERRYQSGPWGNSCGEGESPTVGRGFEWVRGSSAREIPDDELVSGLPPEPARRQVSELDGARGGGPVGNVRGVTGAVDPVQAHPVPVDLVHLLCAPGLEQDSPDGALQAPTYGLPVRPVSEGVNLDHGVVQEAADAVPVGVSDDLEDEHEGTDDLGRATGLDHHPRQTVLKDLQPQSLGETDVVLLEGGRGNRV